MKQKQFKLWFGIGFGYDKSITGGQLPKGQSVQFIVHEYTFLCFKYGICEMLTNFS